MAKIIVSGSVAYDRIMDYAGNFTDHIIPGKLHTLSVSFQVKAIKEHFGGTAGNIAYNLALLGERPEILATVGTDFDRYEEHMLSHGINIDAVLHDPADLTSVAHIVTDSVNNQIAAFALAAGGKPYGEMPKLTEYDCAMIAAGCVADSLALAKAAAAAGIPHYVDPGQALPSYTAEQLREVIDGAAGLFANDYELSLITEKTGWTEEELLKRTPLVVVTFGAKGSEIRTKDGVTKVAVAPVQELVDPTGAGDAHRAGFLTGLLSKRALLECGQLASTVAAYAVESLGTQNHTFTLDEMRTRYQKAFGQEFAM